jgi:hypothetical protein
MLALASEFLLSGNVLEWLGIPYVEDGGPLAAKLSPGTYLAATSMCVRLMDGGNPLLTAWRVAMREKLLAGCLAGFAFCIVYVTCLHGPDGVIALLDTFLPAGMLCVALHDIAAPQAHRVAAILQVLFTVSAALTLGEAAFGATLIPVYGDGTGAREFRPLALYDHPLTGAAATMLALRLAPPQHLVLRRHAYRLLLLAALISFGGRAALAVSLAASLVLSVRALASRAWRRRVGMVHLLAPIIFLLAGAAVAVVIMTTGLADRLAEHLYWDNSAQARVGQFHLIGLLSPEQIVFGCRRADLIAMIEPLRLAYGVDVIENFWLLMFATLGALGFPVFLLSLVALLQWLWLRGSVDGRVMLVSLMLVASTSNSLGRKSTLLVMLAGCVLTHPRTPVRAYCRGAFKSPAARWSGVQG